MSSIWFLVVLWVAPIHADIIAYDCTGTGAQLARLSLDDVSPCPSPPNSTTITNATVQVLQTRRYAYTRVYQCLVVIRQLIFSCGAFSHASIAKGGYRDDVHLVSPDKCKEMHRTLQFDYHGKGEHIVRLEANSTISTTVTLAGTIDTNMKCTGVDYTDHGITYPSVTVTAAVKVTLADYRARVDLQEDKVSFTSGLTASFSKHSAVDAFQGSLHWDGFQVRECGRESMHVVWSGPASIVVATAGFNAAADKYLIVNTPNSVFALRLYAQTPLCHQTAYTTEHPGLLVVADAGAGFYFREVEGESSIYADTLNYINSKIVYLAYQGRRDILALYQHTAAERCKAEREMLRNRLQLARMAPEYAATLLHKEVGVTGRVAGSAYYIIGCEPVLVTPRDETRCFSDLPVSYRNQSYFMQASTRILAKHGVETDCNPLTPPTFMLAPGTWVALTPRRHLVPAPDQLRPHLDSSLLFEPLSNVGANGLYSNEELRAAQKAFAEAQERNVIAHISHRRIAGKEPDPQGYEAYRLVNPREWEAMATSALTSVLLIFENTRNLYVGIIWNVYGVPWNQVCS